MLEGLAMGDCVRYWTPEYLKKKVGVGRKVGVSTWSRPDRSRWQVIIHQCDSPRMDFQSKNFSYVSKPFGDFVDQVARGGRAYLRSLAVDQPASKPADLEQDFPEIAQDFRLPPELDLVAKRAHSSPLRMSGPVTMWLHYDVRTRHDDLAG